MKLSTRKYEVESKDFSCPPLGILSGDQERKIGAAYLQDYKLIVLSIKYIERWSNEPQSKNMIVIDRDDVAFEGLIPDMFFLEGAEETTHSDFHHKNGQYPRPDTSSMSLEEYDAEFDGLVRQKEVAIEAELPEHTIKVIDDRIKAAEGIRNRKLRENPPLNP